MKKLTLTTLNTIIGANLLLAGFSATLHASEKYQATIEDGTAKTLKANTKFEDQEDRNQASADLSPAAPTRNSPTSNSIDALTKRLEVLEQEKQTRLATEAAKTPMQTNSAPAPVVVIQPTISTPAAPAIAVVPATEVKANPSLKKELFDQVPDQKIKEVAERLKYTNEILKRFGRAYDYRTTTIAQFKKILSDLESKTEPQTEVR